MKSNKRWDIEETARNISNEIFPSYLFLIETNYDIPFVNKFGLIDIESVFSSITNSIEFENYSDLQMNLFFDVLDRHFVKFEKRNWTTFNYLTNLFTGNNKMEVPEEISFIKEDAYLKLVQDKIEENRNQISLKYKILKNHFLLKVEPQNNKTKINKRKEKKEVYDFLDDIRNNNYTKLDLRKKLKKLTDFDFDNLKYLYDDVDLYINIEKDEFQSNFSEEEISEKLKHFEEKGYTTEKLISLGYLKEFKVPKFDLKGNPLNLNVKDHIYINKEKLLFPFEFYSIYEFQNMIIAEISKHKKIAESKNETQETNKNTKLKTNLSVPELALLFKLINDLKPNIFVLKSEAELLRFISSNFETKKTGENDISTNKLRILFNQPEYKAAVFWEEKLGLMLSDVKKLK